MKKKTCKLYYFSVEGETEKWYLEHLQKLINNTEEIPFKIKLDIEINKSITSRMKNIVTVSKNTKAFHLCDYESNQEIHVKQFEKVLEELKNSKKINSNINYKLGYSNFTFDLWIILHKTQKKGAVTDREKYLAGINKAYNENFQSMKEYKEEKNFKKILAQITLEDIIKAIKNGNEIRQRNIKDFKEKYRQFGKFEYYMQNPDMTINECIEQILQEIGVLKQK